MRKGGRAVLTIIAITTCATTASCSRRALGVLVDLPQPERSENSQGAAQGPEAFTPGLDLLALYLNPLDTVVPEIEKTLDPDSVVAMLPRDHAGNIDWVAALRHEVIRPRDGIDGPRSPPPGSFEFGFDFYFPGPAEMFDAYFPHSAHTEIMECAQCHPRIFRTRPAEFMMADVFAGKYCGECHGTVAYPVMTGCERCHTALPQPPNRAEPELIGTVQMRRAAEILAESTPIGDSTTAPIRSNAAGVSTDGLATSIFPHWVHRIRYNCRTCHLDIFEPQAGTNAVTMVDIAEGRACGQCHNGAVAFAPQMDNCEVCHVPPQAPVATGAARQP
ncbi:MAG: hypothetical protein OEN56_12245 [Gemmatimonadota bacterium]|nr:hypothetical protein [Gemmatimonadota bacterium]